MDDIWAKDVLDRKKNADYLRQYLTQRYLARREEEGFVLAINAEWGFGKTFMLRCWKDDLLAAGYPAVYFDAWKNDFTPEPLVAFISEIDDGLSLFFKKIPRARKIFRDVMKSAKQVLKPAIKAAGFSVAKHALGLSSDSAMKLLSEASGTERSIEVREVIPSISDIEKNVSSAVDAALKQHKNTKVAVSAFKDKLASLVSVLSGDNQVNLPLFIFVDELDRCRPDYAIELLEGIKHLFGVPGVYFVVATNMQQHGESTKAIYGAGFDGHRYLKRFFDMEYFLPLPDSKKFSESLFMNVSLPDISNFVTFNGRLSFEGHSFLPYMFSVYADYFGCGLRDQFQAMKIFEAALYSVKDKKIHAHFLIYLCMLYQRSPPIYEELFRVRTFQNFHNYSSIISKIGDVGFKINTVVNGSVVARNISPTEVAKTYLDVIFKAASILSQLDDDADSFPGLLKSAIIRDSHQGNFSAHYVSEYFNIVRSAGAFSDGFSI